MLPKLPEPFSQPPSTNRCSPAVHVAIQLLWKAWQHANDVGVDRWQFAVELSEFRVAGVEKADLRWLVAQQYVQVAGEVTIHTASQRQFSPINSLFLPPNACLVLSKLGVESLTQGRKRREKMIKISLRSGANADELRGLTAPSLANAEREHPVWDSEQRILRVGQQIVKHFRVPAPNQEKVLAAFHELEWAIRIDDPLPGKADHDPQRRLNDTIRCLNRGHVNQLLRFHGDGTGTGVRWEALH